MAVSQRSAPPARRSRGLLLTLSGNMLLDAIEVSVAVVALPSIARELGFTATSVQWVVGGFALGFGALLPFAARIAARFGRRGGYLGSLLGFAATSVVAALAGSAVLLVITRVLKGFCVALTAPTGLAIIAGTYPPGPPRDRALRVYTLCGASGFSLGLLLSGVLTTLDWRWTFLLPAPVAVALFLVALRVIPHDGPVPAPPLRFGVLARGTLVRAMLCAAALNGSFWGFLYVVTLDAQGPLGWSPLVTGLAILPASLLLTVSVPLSGRLVGRFGAPRLIAAGMALPPAGYALYLTLGAPLILPSMALVGVGYALCFAALHVQALAGVPDADRAMAGGLYQASVQLGGAAVLAMVATLAAALTVIVGATGFLVALAGFGPLRDEENP